eukprot:CAMPEP_0183311710 /NCGR_PEP_ID=MMETSP0160_2-20130417/38497_1 /TAXON_ID=2839 ORGANISM="Odontella Sinensis, Strain Grunow 1884" /NCGR_SAMPLE_ID=MMETSP0160_2 /ASSEMBLY_ACC=CAM_ASM_000250 /LENGTH=258 /DNA_ID=CAMNT_0025476377 /DNA_START=274 /DNA_END=1046 /DNA_ORIENTATION=+
MAEEQNKGPPPASDQAIRRLPLVVVKAEDLVDESNRYCSVCFEEHNVGDKLTRLPCSHLYHHSCILKWLETRCTCPVCRYELPTSDEEYEVGRMERMKHRCPRLRYEDLENMSSEELHELAFERLRLDGKDDPILHRFDLIDRIWNSGKIENLETSDLARYKLSDLRSMRVKNLRQAMVAADVFFEPCDVVEKEDMIQLFVQSGRVLVLPEVISSDIVERPGLTVIPTAPKMMDEEREEAPPYSFCCSITDDSLLFLA